MSYEFPGLQGLSGGRKQKWLNDHADMILSLSQVIEFDELCSMLNCEPGTLSSTLKRAEASHRPMITKADKALAEAQRASINTAENSRELAVQSQVLNNLISNVNEQSKNLSEYFALLAKASSMMSQMLEKQQNDTKSLHNIYLVRTGIKSPRLLTGASGRLVNYKPRYSGVSRLFVSTSQNSSRLPGTRVKRTDKRSRNCFHRRPNV